MTKHNVPHHDKCPDGWKKQCYPRHCDTIPLPQPQPNSKPTPTTTPTPNTNNTPVVTKAVHNVVYLVDEHDVSKVDLNKNVNEHVTRNGNTIIRRWAWHHTKVNLVTMNVPEEPDSITLHPSIATPDEKRKFKWEGFMFDVPADKSVLRVGIVEGADMANPKELTGQGGPGKIEIDRVVGFAGVYPDPAIPFGPVVQVRRDDSYRLLAASYQDKKLPKVQFRCAYYITKETPTQPTPAVAPSAPSTKIPYQGPTLMAEGGNPDEPPVMFGLDEAVQAPLDNPPPSTDPNAASADLTTATDAPSEATEPVPFAGENVASLTYDQIMDLNVSDDVEIIPGESWGGQVFGWAFADNVPATPEDPPAIDQNTPAVDQATPAVDQTTPVADQNTPAVDQNANKDPATNEQENKPDTTMTS